MTTTLWRLVLVSIIKFLIVSNRVEQLLRAARRVFFKVLVSCEAMRADSKVSAKKWPPIGCFAYNTLHQRVKESKSLRAALRILMVSSKHLIMQL